MSAQWQVLWADLAKLATRLLIILQSPAFLEDRAKARILVGSTKEQVCLC